MAEPKLAWVKVEWRLAWDTGMADWEVREWVDGSTGRLMTAGTMPLDDPPPESLEEVMVTLREAVEHASRGLTFATRRRIV
jgi:hypothetical protein